MWDNYIGQQIRRCNRNLLLVNAALLLAIIAYATANSRYLANFLLGTANISRDELAALQAPDKRFRFFVRVNGERSFATGLQSIEQKVDKYSQKVQSQSVKAEYLVLLAGQKLLVVKAPPNSRTTQFAGTLVSIPADVYRNTVAAAIRNEPRLEGAFVPAMLNAYDFRKEGYWTLGIGVPLLALAGWNLWKWKRRCSDYAAHPISKRLSSFGVPEQVAQQIDAAVKVAPSEVIGKATFQGAWLFAPSMFALTIFHIPDVVWVYQKVTKHYTNFIPTGKSYATVLRDRFGYCTEIQDKEKNAESLMGHIVQQAPWVVAGYSKELEQLWKSHPADFVAGVEERRSAYRKAASG